MLIDECYSTYDGSKAKEKGLKAKNDWKNIGRRKVPVFGLPSKEKQDDERKRWIKSIPYLTETVLDKLKTDPVVCIKHWPKDFAKVKAVNGKERPLDPPSIFEGVPKSEIPTPPPPQRPTNRSYFEGQGPQKRMNLKSF